MIEILIKQKLVKRGKTIYWLAKEMKMSYSAVSKLCESNTARIKFSTLNELCRVLECQPGEIFVFVNAENNVNKQT